MSYLSIYRIQGIDPGLQSRYCSNCTFVAAKFVTTVYVTITKYCDNVTLRYICNPLSHPHRAPGSKGTREKLRDIQKELIWLFWGLLGIILGEAKFLRVKNRNLPFMKERLDRFVPNLDCEPSIPKGSDSAYLRSQNKWRLKLDVFDCPRLYVSSHGDHMIIMCSVWTLLNFIVNHLQARIKSQQKWCII